MAPHNVQDDAPSEFNNSPPANGIRPPTPPPMSASPPRILIIGAGSRGHTYSRCIAESSNGVVISVCEPHAYKRQEFVRMYIRRDGKEPPEGSSFHGWRDFVQWEIRRREREAAGEEGVPEGVDAAFVCVRDEMHHDVVLALAPLGLHIMCEKPLAGTLDQCIAMYNALAPSRSRTVFSVGHVLRYSPHNMLLRKLLLEDRAIGDILSVVHTEPVGYWHFAHSYVRGNWRKESTTAPSLLAKSCHDMDILLWLLCSPARPGSDEESEPPHIPAEVSSMGSLQFFRKSRKPKAAGDATNCLRCPAEPGCLYSSRRIYEGPRHAGLETGNRGWPVSIVLPDIESFGGDVERARPALLARLAEDYDAGTPQAEVDAKNWFGRCVFESDNDVCDEQVVTIRWDDDPLPSTSGSAAATDSVGSRGAKQATFHMVAQTKRQCERFTSIYGTLGEVSADSYTIAVEDYATGGTRRYTPKLESGGHGGGDHGIARQFVLAVDRVKNHGWEAPRAQAEFIGCSLEEIVRSHAIVFAAEDARKGRRHVDFREWCEEKGIAAIAAS
ncbi:NAD(P)-binding protein [Daldinia caldariorum]|uniref:NAD(P)-binding protein n=1 Tax=Daldinia caldariorum TaxID=326644 RepID=UPI002007CEFB|nr:NAD(P)-binding protein [Daldinia caldariorum]KAI1467499.1 NAD(P)-binding protein [Daldinia caldariorum]